MLFLPSLLIKKDKLLIKIRLINLFYWQVMVFIELSFRFQITIWLSEKCKWLLIIFSKKRSIQLLYSNFQSNFNISSNHQKIYIVIILLQINQFCIKPIKNKTRVHIRKFQLIFIEISSRFQITIDYQKYTNELRYFSERYYQFSCFTAIFNRILTFLPII